MVDIWVRKSNHFKFTYENSFSQTLNARLPVDKNKQLLINLTFDARLKC
jgi:hypothetical protein